MGAKIYDTPGAASNQPEDLEPVEGRRQGVVRVVRRPRRSTWLYWLTEGVRDVADSVDRTNTYLEQDRPAKAAEAFLDVFSLRRFAVLLPGGGVLRGARRPPAVVESSIPTARVATPPVPPAEK
jgi:hypothetical protein